jgi:hypothetical protein
MARIALITSGLNLGFYGNTGHTSAYVIWFLTPFIIKQSSDVSGTLKFHLQNT